MHSQSLKSLAGELSVPADNRLRLWRAYRARDFPDLVSTNFAKSAAFLCARNGLHAIRNCKELGSTSRNGSSFQRSRGACETTVLKNVDIATLGNLCVDIVLNVPSLPPASAEEKRAYMESLSASRPEKKYWEAGGNCNLAIAAARLGLKCLTLGLVGEEVYGRFLGEVLGDEGISMVKMNDGVDSSNPTGVFYETLRCWVLVDPLQRHGFCSIHDFSKEPAFSWLRKLTGQVKKAIERSKILFCNGYAYDELSPDLIVSVLEYARSVGTAVFFDPGPRGKKLLCGSPDQQRAFKMYLKLSDVLLLTADEAESLTGATNPIKAGQELIKGGNHTRWVIIKMGSKGSLLITRSRVCYAPAFKVSVVDTVGCGDSFTAAVAFGFLENIPAINTLVLANAVGGATATGCGAGRNVASLEKVMEMLTMSDLDAENILLDRLFDEDLDVEVIIPSNKHMNGAKDNINHIFMENVVSELLPKLQNSQKDAVTPL